MGSLLYGRAICFPMSARQIPQQQRWQQQIRAAEFYRRYRRQNQTGALRSAFHSRLQVDFLAITAGSPNPLRPNARSPSTTTLLVATKVGSLLHANLKGSLF